ncbi:MAG: peptidylprolyl isomerase [Candidatus Aureabacteria bacterium]|nr:peptidylprolyl isomerase [Candidatus Auribacterota bacterium]
MEKPVFTQKRQNLNRSVLLAGVLLFCLSAVIIALVLRNSRLIVNKPAREISWNASQMREYANKLKADGLVGQSLKAYEEYVQNSGIDESTRSNIYFSIGEMLMTANRYEDALAYFYKAEIADPDTSLKQEIGTNIVMCLEKSNRALDAEYQLESRTLLGGNKGVKKPSGEVVARIKNREITVNEINRALEELPPWVKESFVKDEAKKLDFLKTYVAGELFYEKGIKLGYDRDPEIIKKSETIKKELIVKKLIDNEILSKIKSEEDDLKNYYEVYKDRYAEKPAVKFKYILTDSEDNAKSLISRIESGADFKNLAEEHSLDKNAKENGGMVSGWVNETGYIPGIGTNKELVKELFQLPDDKKPYIIKTEEGFYIAEILEKKEKIIKSFEDVKAAVESSYRQDKSQKAMREFIEDILTVKDVEIYSKKFIPLNKNTRAPDSSTGKSGGTTGQKNNEEAK